MPLGAALVEIVVARPSRQSEIIRAVPPGLDLIMGLPCRRAEDHPGLRHGGRGDCRRVEVTMTLAMEANGSLKVMQDTNVNATTGTGKKKA